MQTFLPYADFKLSAASLDNKRLGKQRVETLQILRSLTGVSRGWVNHPAVRMWSGHESRLAEYGQVICVEWMRRGFKDTCYDKISSISVDLQPSSSPPWLGDQLVHISHQSNLLRKDPQFYGPLFPSVPSDLPYVWPR